MFPAAELRADDADVPGRVAGYGVGRRSRPGRGAVLVPSLTPGERAAVVRPIGRCATCGAVRVRNYCRTCDEFFVVCGCTPPPQPDHLEHRVYLWTPDGVIAVPDFDALLEGRAHD